VRSRLGQDIAAQESFVVGIEAIAERKIRIKWLYRWIVDWFLGWVLDWILDWA
jgi:hypothetical protein